jgi:hypothetical protein
MCDCRKGFRMRFNSTFGDLELTANTKTPAHPFSSWLHKVIEHLLVMKQIGSRITFYFGNLQKGTYVIWWWQSHIHMMGDR